MYSVRLGCVHLITHEINNLHCRRAKHSWLESANKLF
jgi:hypothetical protein